MTPAAVGGYCEVGVMGSLVSRRRIIKLAMALGSVASLGLLRTMDAFADAVAKVNEKESMAVALGYVADARRVDAKANPAYQAGASCSTCSWYQGKPGDKAGGPCTFFPGKNVDSGAWCKMWNRKQ